MTKQPFVFQIVGYSNSGKTTLMKKWIQMLSVAGKQVAVIKHHGHREPLSSLDDGKDSAQLRQAGARSTVVSTPMEIQWQLNQPMELKHIIALHSHLGFNFLLVEGYKKENFPKLLLLKNKDDFLLMEECTNVKAIICWQEEDVVTVKLRTKVPVFHLPEEESYLNWLDNLIK